MNLELLESFGQNFPEDFDGALDCVSFASTCAFNKRGTLLAVGCNDGKIFVWDFLTRGVTKVLTAHIHPICSISWTRCGNKLISASTENVVSVWDILSGESDRSFRFPSPVLKVQYHPRDNGHVLICPMKHPPVLLSMDGAHKVVPQEDEVSADPNVAASFDRRGKYIYTGNARGRILVFDSETFGLVASFKLTQGATTSSAVKSIEFSRRGSTFLVNSADRIIRVYEEQEVLACGKNGEPEPMQKLQDLVNRTMWKKCCFSGDGEYVCAGSARQHSLYIWEKGNGNLVKILHGTKGEMLLDVVWHPVRPIIASISSGVVSVWAQNQVENWSAFAPDFKELDENQEYDERESEFDLEDEDKSVTAEKGPKVEDEVVDITTVDPIAAFVSSDEEGEDNKALLYLPVAPDIDETEEAPPAQEQVAESPPEKKKRKKAKQLEVDLQDAPIDEIHPMLSTKKANEKSMRNKNNAAVGRVKTASRGTKNDYKKKRQDIL